MNQKKRGPRFDPCGTPQAMCFKDDEVLSILHSCALPCKFILQGLLPSPRDSCNGRRVNPPLDLHFEAK